MRNLFTVLAICAAFILGFVVGRMPLPPLLGERINSTKEEAVVRDTPMEASTEDVVVKTNALSESQQQMLSSLGINASEIVITPAMIACAEAKVGAARLKELEGGSMPSVAEGLSLLACYRQ